MSLVRFFSSPVAQTLYRTTQCRRAGDSQTGDGVTAVPGVREGPFWKRSESPQVHKPLCRIPHFVSPATVGVWGNVFLMTSVKVEEVEFAAGFSLDRSVEIIPGSFLPFGSRCKAKPDKWRKKKQKKNQVWFFKRWNANRRGDNYVMKKKLHIGCQLGYKLHVRHQIRWGNGELKSLS